MCLHLCLYFSRNTNAGRGFDRMLIFLLRRSHHHKAKSKIFRCVSSAISKTLTTCTNSQEQFIHSQLGEGQHKILDAENVSSALNNVL